MKPTTTFKRWLYLSLKSFWSNPALLRKTSTSLNRTNNSGLRLAPFNIQTFVGFRNRPERVDWSLISESVVSPFRRVHRYFFSWMLIKHGLYRRSNRRLERVRSTLNVVVYIYKRLASFVCFIKCIIFFEVAVGSQILRIIFIELS